MIIQIILVLCSGIIGYKAGESRKVGPTAGFLLGLIPVVGVLIVFCLPRKPIKKIQTAKPASTSSDAEQLKEWHRLKEIGAITQEEFDKQKEKFLGNPIISPTSDTIGNVISVEGADTNPTENINLPK